MLNSFGHDSDNETFSKIYTRFKKPILKYVLLRISDPQSAEDIAQDIFAKVYKFRDSYDESQDFSTWLWTIARNTVFDALRKQRSIGQYESIENIEIENVVCGNKNAESLLQLKQLRKLMLKMLRPLTRLQRQVIWMRVVHQRSYDEISRHLGLSLSAVKNLAFRARNATIENFSNFSEHALASR